PTLFLEKEGWRRALKSALTSPPLGRVLRTPTGMERFAPRDSATGGTGASRALGIAVHAVLERIDLATRRDLGVLCEEEATAAGHPELTGDVRQLVSRALDSDIIKEALASPRCFREIPFAAAGDTYLVEGRIDLVFESGQGLTIVDFKTDRVETDVDIAARVRLYRPQGLVYARALSEIAGLPARAVVFHFIRPGQSRTLKVDEGFLAEGRRLLETGSMMPGASE
ncbi:MAG TPA: PD-(D/E)XK nuclease family protein, partial [Candidatus Polarisedimenticolia bacterium]|nr:PD-(D/E)XK nuclease family protein [Candidatus Polarisedimenticolia bacterium]